MTGLLISLLLFWAVPASPPKPDVNTLRDQALAEAQAGKHDEALRDLRAAAELARKEGDRSAGALALFLLASEELNQQDFADSLADAGKAIEASQAAGNPDLEASARALRAESLGRLGRHREAGGELERAAVLVRSGGDLRRLPVLLLLGQAEIDAGRYSQAAARFERALELQRSLGSEEGRGTLLAGLGLSLMKQGRAKDAMPKLEEALQIAQAHKDEKEEASLLAALGNLAVGSENLTAARSYFERAAALFTKRSDLPSLWLAKINLADIDAAEGHEAQHEKIYEQAVAAFRQANDAPKLARALTVLGVLAGRNGCGEEAIRYDEEALALRRRSGDLGGEAQLLRNIAMEEIQLGRPEQALAHLEQALRTYREGGDREDEVRTLLDSGHSYIDLGRLEEGTSRIEEALSISRSIHDRDLEAGALCMKAEMLFVSGHAVEAFLKIEEAGRTAQGKAERMTELSILGTRGLVLLGLKRPRESLATLAEARQLSQELHRPCEEAQVLLATGSAHLVAGELAQGKTAFEKARDVQRTARCFVSRDTTFLALGALYEVLGEQASSVDAYGQAAEVLETAMEEIRTNDLLAGVVGQAALVYPRLLRLLVQAGKPDAAFTLAERDRSRALLRELGSRRIDIRQSPEPDLIAQEQELRGRLEALKQRARAEKDPTPQAQLSSELEERRRQYETLLTRLKLSNPEYASLVHPAPLAIATVQQLLDRETTLVEYFVLDREVLAWAIDHGSRELVRLPIGRADLQNKIELLRNRIALREPAEDLAKELFQSLFAPLASYVHHSNLLIVPHGALHLLPFAALRDGAGHPLVESHTLAFLPSASVLPFILAKRRPVAGPMLVLGDPDGSLSHAAAEARAVAQLFGTEPLLGPRATKTALRERASQAGILHIAAHTSLDSGRPLFSRVNLARDARNDGDLEAHEVFGLDLSHVSLVVLAGCSTGENKVNAGDDLSGLTRAFLYAGAPAVVTTLWPINDEASMELMKIFYLHLHRGESPASALREAQLEIRRQDRWKLPYYWAAFGLTGMPELRP
ncbi:MAG TPA: CHAT domain-containing protein [Thermoanaerobaculia bacterium]|nr:CHAT domain-containing protein [Thermoanaerobaculia bacterium]